MCYVEPDLDEFTHGYILAALLWTHDDEGSLGRRFGFKHIDEATFQKMVDDCREFQARNAQYLIQENTRYRSNFMYWSGEDFWGSRDQFWNLSGFGRLGTMWIQPASSILHNDAESMGEVELYYNPEDNTIYDQAIRPK